MKVLCHAGPWSDSYLEYIVESMYPGAECTVLSGHKKVDKSGVCNTYYSEINSIKKNIYSPNEEDFEVISRCRLLRALEIDEALLHLYSMRKAIALCLDNFNPDIVITETIDSYIMDLLDIESRKRSIPCVGLVTVFVNGYYRVSIRGEYVKSRDVADNEALTVLQGLDKENYVPSFVANSRKNLARNVIRNWARNLVKIPYFYTKRLLSKEYYNYHYWQATIVSKRWAAWFPVIDPGSNNWLERLTNSSSTVIYIPLQMFPEATIDYWCESLDIIDYENALISFVRKHSDIVFLIKEHPNVGGFRSNKFYSELKSCENVVICPTSVHSNSLRDYYSAVLVWTGSVGFESAIRGKPVLCASRPYYFSKDYPCFIFSMKTETAEIEKFIYDFPYLSQNVDKFQLVKYLLEGCLPGRVRFDGSWSKTNEEHVKEAETLGKSLKAYIETKCFERIN